jgi:hypothetical protein
MSMNSNTNFNLLIGNYAGMQEALRGAENYIRQPSELEVHGEEEEELLFRDTPTSNLAFLGGGKVIADTQGNVSTSNEYVTYNPISRSYRIERLNRKTAKELEEIERQ